jgi:hypothetical protein
VQIEGKLKMLVGAGNKIRPVISSILDENEVEKLFRIVLTGSCLILIFLFFRNILLLLDINIWRHDAIYYYESYEFKLKTEGRWINYFLFDFLKFIPPHLSIIIRLSCIFTFFYMASFRLSGTKFYSLFLGLSVLQMPPLYPDLLWPTIGLAGWLFLGLSSLVVDKFKMSTFFVIFSILSFGTSSVFHFLILLLFLAPLYDESSQDTSHLSKFTQLVFLWIITFIFGFIVSNVMVYLLTGQYGMRLAYWRKPHYVTSLDDLIVNAGSALNYLKYHLSIIISLNHRFIYLLLIALFGLMAISRKSLYYIAIPLLVALSVYVSTIPVGIVIQFRTVIPLFAGLMFVFFVSPRLKMYEKLFLTLLCLAISFKASYYSYDMLNWYRNITTVYATELSKVIDRKTRDVDKIVFSINTSDLNRTIKQVEIHSGIAFKDGIEGLGQSYRLRPALLSVGPYKNVIYCSKSTLDAYCTNASYLLSDRVKDAEDDGMFISVEGPKGELMIGLNPYFLAGTEYPFRPLSSRNLVERGSAQYASTDFVLDERIAGNMTQRESSFEGTLLPKLN